MNTKGLLHGIRIELMEIKRAINSRQARRERLVAGALAGHFAPPDAGEWPTGAMMDCIEELLDASDDITRADGS